MAAKISLTVDVAITCETCGTTWKPRKWHHGNLYSRDGDVPGQWRADVVIQDHDCPVCNALDNMFAKFKAMQERERNY